MGLIQLVSEKNGLTWAPTALLLEQWKKPPTPIDLTPLTEKTVDGSCRPQMAGSLRLMIEDIVEIKRQQQPELEERNCVDAILIGFAGAGLASLIGGPGDEPMWSAHPELFFKFESIRAGLGGRSKYRKTKIQMDDLLKMVVAQFEQMTKAKFGITSPKLATTITTLLTLETAGEAIAYKDNKGRLAWKASGQLRDSFTGG
jgi:hypothetical protein